MCTNHLQHEFSWGDPCLFKVYCLIKVISSSSYFMQEKTTKFIILFSQGLIWKDNAGVFTFIKFIKTK